MKTIWTLGVAGALAAAQAAPAMAAAPGDHQLDGASLPLVLAVPFVGMLLSIALGPMLAGKWWHRHYGAATLVWTALSLIGLSVAVGGPATLAALIHIMALDYIPFILMLFALFTAAGGVAVTGTLASSPAANCALLAIGAACASVIGTTGASMILIRPLIRANAKRPFNAHVVVFFIFLVSNVGGALSPLGDPPLFLGFLNGVDFFWTARHLWAPTLFAVLALLAVFFALDSFLRSREKGGGVIAKMDGLKVEGTVNLPLIGVVILAIIVSGLWRPGLGFDLYGTRLEAQNLLREAALIVVALASLALTPQSARHSNGFDWEPIREVAILFAGIFSCIIPVLAMLKAGAAGPFAPAIALLVHPDGTPHAAAYFWTTGLLSAFLDNAPTYLVFFELAGGDPAKLMGPLAQTLAAISLGAVFMGALTYIGNAPNFMVYAIARRSRVKMPEFFGYMLWSGAVLLPLFGVITWLFF